MAYYIQLIILLFLPVGIWAGNVQQNAQKLEKLNWVIQSGDEKECLTISHKHLGVILQNIQFYLTERDRTLQPIQGIKVEKEAIVFTTGSSLVKWKFRILHDGISLDCSKEGGVVKGIAPADNNRFPARVIDPSGNPVAWCGTDEVKSCYGGKRTEKLSYLPKKNPEVLYMAMGLVSANNFHALFDRKNDMVIRFPEQTRMKRINNDPEFLEVTLSPGDDLIQVIENYYRSDLGLSAYHPVDNKILPKAPAVWNSWSGYRDKVSEKDIMENVDWISNHLNGYGIKYIVIDDGCERGPEGEHYWISNWDQQKFPHGPEGITQYIKSKNFKPGLWIVPNAYAGALKEHPEWYLYDVDGKFIYDYNTPVLDYTNPEVLNFLQKMFTTLDDWGFEYYKFDGEFALLKYVPDIDTGRIYDSTVDALAAYKKRLSKIRETIGNDIVIEGCPAGTPLDGIGYFNLFFTGEDVYNSWLGMYPFFNSLNANIFLNNIVCCIMPGEGISIMPEMSVEEAHSKVSSSVINVAKSRENNLKSLGTNLNEARTLVTFSALSGATYSFTDKLSDLPEERINLLKKTLPTMPVVPMDLFSRGGYMHWDIWKEYTPESYKHHFPEIIDLKINAASGRYDVVSVTNWSGKDTSITLSLMEKLGLEGNQSYVLFDFWNQKLKGVVKKEVNVNIEPHDSRVFIIREKLNRPQYLATNRHISCAESIKSLEWDASQKLLSGSSLTVEGDTYSLFFYVPGNTELKALKHNGKLLSTTRKGDLLQLTFQGQKLPVDWELYF